MLRFSEFTNNKIYEQGAATATPVVTPQKRVAREVPNQEQRNVQLTNTERKNDPPVSEKLPHLRELENNILALQKKIAGKRGTTTDPNKQQQQHPGNVASVKLVKDVDFTIKDNAYTYNFNYIGADEGARVPYYSFSKAGFKDQFIYVPKEQFNTIKPTLDKLAMIAQSKPNQIKDETIASSIKAALTNMERDETPIGQNNLKLGGVAKDVWVAIGNFLKWGLIQNNTPYSNIKQLLNKVKSEDNNKWMIRKPNGGNYKFDEQVKVGDTIKVAHFDSNGNKWLISKNSIAVKELSIKNETTF
jgi:hypothetical protein